MTKIFLITSRHDGKEVCRHLYSMTEMDNKIIRENLEKEYDTSKYNIDIVDLYNF